MKQNILILNVCRYADKQSGLKKNSFQYILTNDEAVADNSNFKGYSVLTAFVNSDKIDELSSILMRDVVMECEFVSSTKNPLKPRVNIKGFTDVKTNKHISLV